MILGKEIRVLLVDDEALVCDSIKRILASSSRFRYNITHSASMETGLALLKGDANLAFDICLLDFYLDNGLTALDFLKRIGGRDYPVPVVILTGANNSNIDLKCLESGAVDYLCKDIVLSNFENGLLLLEKSAIYAIERKRLEVEARGQAEINEAILDTSMSGICVINITTDMIHRHNPAMTQMFKLTETQITTEKISQLLQIRVYERSSLDSDRLEKHSLLARQVQSSNFKEVSIKTPTGRSIDCLMQCRKIVCRTGLGHELKVCTFVDISRQKTTQKKLVEAQNEMKQLVLKHGIDSKRPEVILDLVGLELNNIESSEALARWEV